MMDNPSPARKPARPSAFLLLLLLSAAAAIPSPPLPAQEPTPACDLETLTAEHRRRLKEAESQKELSAEYQRFAATLEEFLAHEAKGKEKLEGRLLLTGTYMSLGKKDRAKATLLQYEIQKAPPLLAAAAALWANRLGLLDKKREWVDAALAAKAGFEERMELGRVLMTELMEVEKGEKVYQLALAAAKSDGDRARVLWYRAVALRDREDLGEDAYPKALQDLANRFPKTRYGSIAKDRLAAMELKVGGPPLAFSLKSLDGKQVQSQGYKGRVLLLFFWESGDAACRDVVSVLKSLARKNPEALAILGISLDESRKQLEKATAELGITWPTVYGGAGWDSDMALRYRVEHVPWLLLIGRDGKIAALNLYPTDKIGVRELEKAVAAAVQAKGEPVKR